MSLLVFTDLDGTLMEHESYSIEAARPALAALADRNIVPIINSSKTYAEIREIQNSLEISGPCICENGAALFSYQTKQKLTQQEFGKARTSWLDKVQQLREQLNFEFTGFSDWTADELSEITGLSTEEASLARQREYSEPILWRDTSKAFTQFLNLLDQLALQVLEGGRFFSIQGKHDKSTAMDWLKESNHSPDLQTVALGDSPNDISMLEAADIAVIIKSGKSDQIDLKNPKTIIRTNRPGPSGWHDAIFEILERLEAGELNKT